MSLSTYAAAQLLRILPRRRISHAVGQLCELPLPPTLSRAVVNAYVNAYHVDMKDALEPAGASAYKSFDEFFTRRLRRGARPLEEGSGLLCPADGCLESVGPIHENGRIEVKSSPYDAAELLGCTESAKYYEGGQFAVIYLSPRDYHRVHAPANGTMVEVRSCPGELFPVNAISEQHIPHYLSRNRRVAMVFDTERFGRVTMVMVAAMIVGRITVTGFSDRDVPIGTHHMADPLAVKAGDEVGIFHLGSTVVIFTEAGAPAIGGPKAPIAIGSPCTMGRQLTEPATSPNETGAADG